MGTFRRKDIEITLNDATKALIEKFIEALKEHKLDESMIAPTGKKDRKGLWSIVVKTEYLLDTALNGQTYTLSPLEVQMDDHVQLFLEEYLEYWNDLLDKDKVSIEDRQATQTGKPLITIKEIFIRACADALGQDMTGAHDGEVIVKAMKSFVEKIGQLQKILKIGVIFKEHTNTMLALKTTHPYQLVKIENLVRSVKLLHLNKSTLLNASNLIKKIEINTMRLILAELSELESIDELAKHFDDEYVKRGVKQLENKLMERNLSLQKEFEEFSLDKSQSMTKYIEKLNLTDVARQQHVLDTIKDKELSRLKNDLKKKDNLQRLYELLNDTYYISEMMAGANLFNVLTSWIGIVTGCINMDGYAELFNIHANQVEQILKIDGNQLKTRGSVTTGIMEFSFSDGVGLSNDCVTIAKELRNLQSPEIITTIIKSIEHTINLIVSLQKQSPAKFQKITVINADLCANFLQAIKKEALPKPINSINNSHRALSSSLPSLPAASLSPNLMLRRSVEASSPTARIMVPYMSVASSRQGLEKHQEFMALLKPLIPKELELGKALSEGGCFFDALAQIINIINSTNVNTAKYLRMLCHDFYLRHKTLVDKWIMSDNPKSEDVNNYYFVQYTMEECDEHFNGQAPIWGRPAVEGKILCRVLQLACLCVIEIFEDAETSKPVLGFYLAGPDDYQNISQATALELLKNPKIPTLIVEQNSLHFVPLIDQNKLAALEQQTLLPVDEHHVASRILQKKKLSNNNLLSPSPSFIQYSRDSQASSSSSASHRSASFNSRSSLANESNIMMEENLNHMFQEQLPRDTTLVPVNTHDEISNFYLCFLNAYQHTEYAKRVKLNVAEAQELCKHYLDDNPKDFDKWRKQCKESQVNIPSNDAHHPLIAGRILCKIINEQNKKLTLKWSFVVKVILFDDLKTPKLATISCNVLGSKCEIKDYKTDKLQLNKLKVYLLCANQNYYYVMKNPTNSYHSINNGSYLNSDYDFSESGRDSYDNSSMASNMESSREGTPIVSHATQNKKTTPPKIASSAAANQQPLQLYAKIQEIVAVSPLVALVAAIIEQNNIALFHALFNARANISKEHFEVALNTLPEKDKAHLLQLSQKLTAKDCDLLQLNDKDKEKIFECTLTAHNPWAIKILLNTQLFNDTANQYVRDRFLEQETLAQIAALTLPTSFTEKPILAAVLKVVDDYENNIMPRRNWSKKQEVEKNRKDFIKLFKIEHAKASCTGMLRPLFTLIQLHTDFDKNYNGETRGFRGRSELYDSLRALILPYFKTAEGKVDEAIEQLANRLRECSFSSLRQGKFMLQYNPEQQLANEKLKQQLDQNNAKIEQMQEKKEKELEKMKEELEKMKKEREEKNILIETLTNALEAAEKKLNQVKNAPRP